MSFNRLIYDSDAYKQYTKETEGPYAYVTNSISVESNKKCMIEQPGFIADLGGVRPSMINLESNLRNQTRPYSKTNETSYTPKNCKFCESCTDGRPCGCDHCLENIKKAQARDKCEPQIVERNIRPLHALNNINEVNYNRFHPHLGYDPQDAKHVMFYQGNQRLGEETRLTVKNTFDDKNKTFKTQCL